jgi:hypothetical protein
LLAALAAGIAGHMLTGLAAWIAMGAAVLVGAYAAALAAGGPADGADARAQALLSLLDRGGSNETKIPQGFAGEWENVYRRVNQMAAESHTNSAALAEMERFRRQAELAESALRSGRDPLTEIAELRVGPLRGLLEAAKSGATVGPVVSRLSLGEEELIGVDGDALPEGWPKPSAPASVASGDHEELRRGLDELLRGIEELSGSLGGDGPREHSVRDFRDAVHRTPAQLVDAVVHTAADGIEDLAAGLMRANELASVAERVTNRATLLALNAALEATRSGSEAFAAIAEETRRLAEFAREATDTISRLASEIEYKVGETITAIHATSEDAKTSLAGFSAAAPSEPAAPRQARVRAEALLERARELRRRWGASTPASTAALTAAPAAAADSWIAERAGAPAADDGPIPPPAEAAPPMPAFQTTLESPHTEGPDEPEEASGPAQSLLENDRFIADKLPTEGILLIEGLQPGARLDS